ncbi:MAG TPA: hypothetical protein VGH20_13060 [Myxococcales bacterium]|jgi:hypothetical protein
MNWTKVVLPWRASAPRARPFNPVPLLVSAWPSDTEQGSGFFVHPAVLVTAAHVVFTEGQVASRISVDCGSSSAVVAAATLPDGYLRGEPEAPDVAVLWLGESLCAMEQTVIMSSMGPGASVAATLLGWGQGAFGRRDVDATKDAELLRYDVEDLPGFSGGPLLAPRPDPAVEPSAVGVHFFHDERGGYALPLQRNDVIDAMRLLGFSFG